VKIGTILLSLLYFPVIYRFLLYANGRSPYNLY
jgi:hypothetical protein